MSATSLRAGVRAVLRYNGAILLFAGLAGTILCAVAFAGSTDGGFLWLALLGLLLAAIGLLSRSALAWVRDTPMRRRPWLAWIAALAFVLSPFVLFYDAGPHDAVFPPLHPDGLYLERLAGLGAAGLVAICACAFLRHFWPLVLGILLVVTWPAGWLYNLTSNHPCWSYSNAAWCGHFCDNDPCECPSRSLGPAAYGAGPGCISE